MSDNGAIDRNLLDPHHVGGMRASLPGINGLPFLGTPPNLKDNDPEAKQPQVGAKIHVEILLLNDPKQLEHYTDIFQLIANGFAMLSTEERIYDQELKTWRIFIRWMECYSYVPRGSHG